jgi:hypothetical protein
MLIQRLPSDDINNLTMPVCVRSMTDRKSKAPRSNLFDAKSSFTRKFAGRCAPFPVLTSLCNRTTDITYQILSDTFASWLLHPNIV